MPHFSLIMLAIRIVLFYLDDARGAGDAASQFCTRFCYATNKPRLNQVTCLGKSYGKNSKR